MKQAVLTLSSVSGNKTANIERHFEQLQCEGDSEGMSKVLEDIKKLRQDAAGSSLLAGNARVVRQQTQLIRDEWQRCKAEVERLLLQCDEVVPQCAAEVKGKGRRGGDGSEESLQEPEESSCADGHGKRCSKCGASKGVDGFSGKQWNAKAHSRKCCMCAGVA